MGSDALRDLLALGVISCGCLIVNADGFSAQQHKADQVHVPCHAKSVTQERTPYPSESGKRFEIGLIQTCWDND
jgi:hypothetical protein